MRETVSSHTIRRPAAPAEGEPPEFSAYLQTGYLRDGIGPREDASYLEEGMIDRTC